MSVKNEDGQYPYLMIGEELRYLLKASGVSLKMIADHAGMSNTTIQTLLKGSSVKCIDRKKYFYYDKNKAGIIYLCSDQTQ